MFPNNKLKRYLLKYYTTLSAINPKIKIILVILVIYLFVYFNNVLRSRPLYIVGDNNTRYHLSDCNACGLIDLCNKENNLLYDIHVYEGNYNYIYNPDIFICDKHVTPNIINALKNYKFKEPTFLLIENSPSRYYAYNNIFAYLVTCYDCGSKIGSLCNRPYITIPQVAGNLYNIDPNTRAVFQCHKHMPHFFKINYKTFTIVTPLHTLTLANMMASALKKHDLSVEVIHVMPLNFTKDMYFILAANIYAVLPPPEKRILYQLEQSVSERWFTPTYLKALKESYAVFDYHSENIITLEAKYEIHDNVWYLPVGVSMDLYTKSVSNPVEKEWDLLFYGDVHGRRGPMLKELKKKYKIYVVTEVFGEDMLNLIRQARFVVNIHYYENGLLELPRIFECLSLGVPVISEDSPDRILHSNLNEPLVHFWKYDSVSSMIEVIDKVLKLPNIKDSLFKSMVDLSYKSFMYMFYRNLLGLNIFPKIDTDIILPYIQNIDVIDSRPLILSLPEAAERRKVFLTDKYDEATMGINIMSFRSIFHASWISCAQSYNLIAKVAVRDKLPRLSVAEDDAIFPPKFDDKLKIIHRYLDSLNKNWDLFSGLITDLHVNATISSVEYFEGILFVTIDKMTGMVFNIYNENTYKIMSNWDHEDENAITNTIDRKIENVNNLRVITTFPYLVGHRESTKSTIWGFQNTAYNEFFEKSRKLLEKKLSDYDTNR